MTDLTILVHPLKRRDPRRSALKTIEGFHAYAVESAQRLFQSAEERGAEMLPCFTALWDPMRCYNYPDADMGLSHVACPWTSDDEKNRMIAAMHDHYRTFQPRRYTFCLEAWGAHYGDDAPLDFHWPSVRPRHHRDRCELLVVGTVGRRDGAPLVTKIRIEHKTLNGGGRQLGRVTQYENGEWRGGRLTELLV